MVVVEIGVVVVVIVATTETMLRVATRVTHEVTGIMEEGVGVEIRVVTKLVGLLMLRNEPVYGQVAASQTFPGQVEAEQGVMVEGLGMEVADMEGAGMVAGGTSKVGDTRIRGILAA